MTTEMAAAGPARRRRVADRLSGPVRSRFPMLRIVWRQHWVALSIVQALSAVAIAALIISERALSEVITDVGSSSEWRRLGWTFYGPKYPDLAMQAITLAAAMFVGVQLISRELEFGTSAFAWTQGYSKARWVLGKFAAASAVLVPTAVVLGLVFGWWFRLYVPAIGYFSNHAFALYAPALAGWTLAGLALGMAAATLTRREGRAMWVTLAGWIALHLFVTVGSPHTPSSEFWPLQVAQLAILLAVSALLLGGTIWVLQGAPAVPGMPRLLRAMPRRAVPDVRALSIKLGTRRQLAMARAALRQHRTGLLVAVGVLGAGTINVITGQQPAQFTGEGHVNLLWVLPFVIGAFLGASLTGRELELHTTTFAWAQGISKVRWVTGKLVTVGGALVLMAVGVGLMIQWWIQPQLASRLSDPVFGLYPPAFAGWMAVSVALGAFLGALARNRAPAAVGAVVCCVMAAIWPAASLRSHYLPLSVAVNRRIPGNALVINEYFGRPDGRPLTGAVANRVARATAYVGNEPRLIHVLARFHAVDIWLYQPDSQFWQLQAIEAAGLVAVALLFAAATVWIVRRQDA